MVRGRRRGWESEGEEEKEREVKGRRRAGSERDGEKERERGNEGEMESLKMGEGRRSCSGQGGRGN